MPLWKFLVPLIPGPEQESTYEAETATGQAFRRIRLATCLQDTHFIRVDFNAGEFGRGNINVDLNCVPMDFYDIRTYLKSSDGYSGVRTGMFNVRFASATTLKTLNTVIYTRLSSVLSGEA